MSNDAFHGIRVNLVLQLNQFHSWFIEFILSIKRKHCKYLLLRVGSNKSYRIGIWTIEDSSSSAATTIDYTCSNNIGSEMSPWFCPSEFCVWVCARSEILSVFLKLCEWNAARVGLDQTKVEWILTFRVFSMINCLTENDSDFYRNFSLCVCIHSHFCKQFS